MTGTPLENRLAELWSIIDVTNPRLLGSQRAFNERFAVPVERWHDEAAAQRLRRLIAPFVLRRRKDEPEVAVDLPPKQEITVACALTREQAALYQATVEQAFAVDGLGGTAFERRGRILALLTALKQICNHPRQYLRDDGPLPGRSGKLARASEILTEVVDAGEHALVFTQFREMGSCCRTIWPCGWGCRRCPSSTVVCPWPAGTRWCTGSRPTTTPRRSCSSRCAPAGRG
jgi:SNF2 family DNA or RNA helicase